MRFEKGDRIRVKDGDNTLDGIFVQYMSFGELCKVEIAREDGSGYEWLVNQDDITLYKLESSCTCGATKVNSEHHSNWCDIERDIWS